MTPMEIGNHLTQVPKVEIRKIIGLLLKIHIQDK
ncbi:Modification methylase HindIII, partial [Haemophilus influenzae]